jgi:hypothetical protein
MSLCGRRQCGGDGDRAATATWTKAEGVEFRVRGQVDGDRERTTLGMVAVLD